MGANIDRCITVSYPVSALTSTRQASFCQHGRSLPSPPEISAFYSRLNHAYMHPLTCVKYGAAVLALGPAHSVTVPHGAVIIHINEFLSY